MYLNEAPTRITDFLSCPLNHISVNCLSRITRIFSIFSTGELKMQENFLHLICYLLGGFCIFISVLSKTGISFWRGLSVFIEQRSTGHN